MKRTFYRLILAICAGILLLCLSSCGGDEEEPPTADSLIYDTDQIGEYVRLDAYTGLEISLETADSSKSEAVWNQIRDRAEILIWPEEQVNYYAEQSRAAYRYYAKQNDLDYGEVLRLFGVTEENILEEARQMVKGDLVYHYILQDAGLSLTEEEKENLFDRYVDKFVADYGYSRDYVTENLSDLVLDSMLYDKTMQYLMDRNTFVVSEQSAA